MKGLVAALILLTTAPALADSLMPAAELANVQLVDPAQERAAKSLMETIRCLVCQGQSIADSNADMAGDMRALIRQRISTGETPASVRAWLVDKYGSYITYDPPISTVTSPLWLLPLAFLLFGAFLVRGRLKRRRT